MKPKIKLMRYFGDIVFICEGLGCFGIGKSPSEAYKKWDEFHESLIYFDVVFQPLDRLV